MTQLFTVHPDNPQQRLIKQVMQIVGAGGVVAYPTDSAYALGCHMGDKEALERIRAIRKLDKDHNFTLMCRDLSELSTYAKVDNSVYRLLKAYTPGAYTFILNASKEVPKRLQHPKRKTIGLRIPDNDIVMAMLTELGEPMMSVTLIMPDAELPLIDPDEIYTLLAKRVDAVIDGGYCDLDPTTVIDLTDHVSLVKREGKGDYSDFI